MLSFFKEIWSTEGSYIVFKIILTASVSFFTCIYGIDWMSKYVISVIINDGKVEKKVKN